MKIEVERVRSCNLWATMWRGSTCPPTLDSRLAQQASVYLLGFSGPVLSYLLSPLFCCFIYFSSFSLSSHSIFPFFLSFSFPLSLVLCEKSSFLLAFRINLTLSDLVNPSWLWGSYSSNITPWKDFRIMREPRDPESWIVGCWWASLII